VETSIAEVISTLRASNGPEYFVSFVPLSLLYLARKHDNSQIFHTPAGAAMIVSVELRTAAHAADLRLHFDEHLVPHVVPIVVAEERRFLGHMHLHH
jgi:hypothetical protein